MLSAPRSPLLHGNGKPAQQTTVASQIKDLILANGLHPGDPLPSETELQEILGVSRTSVREAVRALSTLGIVEVRHGHGSFVGAMSLDALVETLVFRGILRPGDDLTALKEIVEVRMHLDTSAANEITAALNGNPDPKLRQLVQEMAALAAEGKDFGAQDRLFHTLLLRYTNNNLITQLVGAFWDVHFAVLPRLGLALPEDLHETVTAHEEMLDAAEAGDVAAYQAAVIKHYNPLLRVLSAS